MTRDSTSQRRDVDDSSATVAPDPLVESIFDALPDIVYAFDRHGQFLRWNERITEVTGYTDEEMASLNPLVFIPEEDREHVAGLIDRVISERTVESAESRLVTKDGTEIPYEYTGAPIVDDGDVVGLTGVGRDIAARKRREETLERLNDLNTVIRSVDRALVEGNTREEITDAVCDRLVADEAYGGAVVGTLDATGEFEVDALAGVDRAALDPIVPAGDATSAPLARRAVADRSVTVLDLWEGDDTGGDPERDRQWPESLAGEYEAVAAVPLVADDQVFGVLGVYSDHRDGFADRERTVLGELGRSVGHAIQSALAQQLLYADAVTEIELRTTDERETFVALSAAADCRLELDRAVAFGDEQVFYGRMCEGSAERVHETASEHDAVSRVARLGTDDSEPRFEVRTRRTTVTAILTDHGARTTAGEADRGVVRVVAELPPDGDVREVVDAVTAVYPDTELLARRTVERSPETAAELRRRLTEDLTDKQFAALEAAYVGGYFEWPARTRNAQEIAESLDVASQTFHQHLRVAQAKLFTALFESIVDEDGD